MNKAAIVPFERIHLPLVLGWVNDPVIKELIGTVRPISMAQHRSWYDELQGDPARLYLIIEDFELRQPVGMVGLNGINPVYGEAELFIYLGDKQHWRKGLGKNAVAQPRIIGSSWRSLGP